MNETGGIEPGSDLEAQVDDALIAHPAGRSSLGFRTVALRPGVLLLECRRCGALLRPRSPSLLDHHLSHRERPRLAERARRLLAAPRARAGGAWSRAETYVRALFERR